MDKSLLAHMRDAIALAANCRPENPSEPRVAAILLQRDGTVVGAYRGEYAPGDHAEFTLLQKKLRSKELTEGATLITTLEPCTTRSHDKKPCANWIIHKGIRNVIIGILDPNPSICGRGYWELVRNGVQVEFFPWELAAEVMKLNDEFVRYHQRAPYSDTLSVLVERHKSPIISRYNLLGWRDAVSVLDSPHLRDGGWPAGLVTIEHNPSDSFLLPSQYVERFGEYYKKNYHEKRFFDDRKKFVLATNPISFSDSETLILKLRATKFSELMFYRDVVAANEHSRDELTEDFLIGSQQCRFAHAINLQMVVATRDDKLLLTKRSPKVAFFPGSWSCSLEEALSEADVETGPKNAVRGWFNRALDEELGVPTDAFHPDNLRVLSVFMETDYLNLNLCGYATLDITESELDRILRGRPRPDTEFVEWRYIPMDRSVLLTELLRPHGLHHPTTGYRLLMSLLKNFGAPSARELTL